MAEREWQAVLSTGQQSVCWSMFLSLSLYVSVLCLWYICSMVCVVVCGGDVYGIT